jgi:hypothetical protein
MPSETHTDTSDLGLLYAQLSDGLHALAQPLTILRSIAVAAANPDLAAADRLRYLDISSEQIERACVLFEGLQDLVIVQRKNARDAATSRVPTPQPQSEHAR